MRINSYTQLTFGHSKSSQRYLDKNIASLEDRQLADALEKCSTICNDTEDLIKKSEKSRGEDFSDSYLIDFFVSLKDMLISNVLLLFEDGDKYLQMENDYYASSLDRCKNKEGNWRRSVLEKIAFWNVDFEEMRNRNSGVAREVSEEEAKDIISKQEAVSNQDSSIKQESAPEISKEINAPVKELAQTKYSPKGFSDIMGMEDLKEELFEDFIKPVNDKDLARLNYEEYGLEIPKGVLLYGPPGCGKTYIIEALSTETKSPVYLLDIASQGSRFINQTSKNIQEAFDYVKTKGEESDSPVFLFMDEIDSLCFNRDNGTNEENLKQVATLLKAIEDVQKHNVIVVGATNKYSLIDPAVKRRFPLKRYVGLPDSNQRIQLLCKNLKNKNKAKGLLADDETMQRISAMLDGYSYKSIDTIANEACKCAMKRGRADISYEDFVCAIEKGSEEKYDESEYKTKPKSRTIGFFHA